MYYIVFSSFFHNDFIEISYMYVMCIFLFFATMPCNYLRVVGIHCVPYLDIFCFVVYIYK